ELRRVFALRKNLEIYRRSTCPNCGGKVYRRVHGERGRRSFFFARCQKVPKGRLSIAVDATSRAGARARRASAASRPSTTPTRNSRQPVSSRSNRRDSS